MAKKKKAAAPQRKRAIPKGVDIDIDAQHIDVVCQADGMLRSPEDMLFGEQFPAALLIPKSEWKAKIEELQESDPFKEDSPHPRGCIVANYTPHVFNQHPESSCVYNAAAGAWMRRFAIANGMGITLSPMSGYCRVARSRHSGAYVWRALELLRDEGLLPSATFKNQKDVFAHAFHENTPFVWANRLPAGWQSTAKQFRVLEWCRISSVEEYGSALLNRMPVVMGRSGHAMVAEDLVTKNGRFYARICDSYGLDNRDGTGRVYDSERVMANSVGGAWACREVARPDNLFEWSLA